MIALIKPKGEEDNGGWVCRIKDGADLTCFEFYVVNGYWHGLFVGGEVEIEAPDAYTMADGEFEVFVNHPSALNYMEYVRQQNLKGATNYGDLDEDKPF